MSSFKIPHSHCRAASSRKNFSSQVDDYLSALTFRHIFRSGNHCVVSLPISRARGGAFQVKTYWRSFPPSREDIQEYRQRVYSRIMAACYEGLKPVERPAPDGKYTEIIPGISILMGGAR